jgi:Matrixin
MRSPVLASLLSVLALAGCQVGPELSFEGDSRSPETVHENSDALIAGAGPAGEQVVFVNFEGGTLTAGTDDPSHNRSSLVVGSPVQFPAYRAPVDRDRQATIETIVAQVRALYSGYRVLFTSSRPPSAPYTMLMVGGLARDLRIADSTVTGTAPLDCGNESADVAFTFSDGIARAFEAAPPEDVLRATAIVIAHETAHTFGLEHSSDATEVMAPVLRDLEVAFRGPAPSVNGATSQCGGPEGSLARLAAFVGLIAPVPAPRPPVPAEPPPRHRKGPGRGPHDCSHPADGDSRR